MHTSYIIIYNLTYILYDIFSTHWISLLFRIRFNNVIIKNVYAIVSYWKTIASLICIVLLIQLTHSIFRVVKLYNKRFFCNFTNYRQMILNTDTNRLIIQLNIYIYRYYVSLFISRTRCFSEYYNCNTISNIRFYCLKILYFNNLM